MSANALCSQRDIPLSFGDYWQIQTCNKFDLSFAIRMCAQCIITTHNKLNNMYFNQITVLAPNESYYAVDDCDFLEGEELDQIEYKPNVLLIDGKMKNMNRQEKQVTTATDEVISYDLLILACSRPFQLHVDTYPSFGLIEGANKAHIHAAMVPFVSKMASEISFIIVYGSSWNALAMLSGMMIICFIYLFLVLMHEYKVEATRIIHVLPDGMESLFADPSVIPIVKSTLENFGFKHYSKCTIYQMEVDEDGKLNKCWLKVAN